MLFSTLRCPSDQSPSDTQCLEPGQSQPVPSRLSVSGCSEETEYNKPFYGVTVGASFAPARRTKKDPLLRGAPKNITAPLATLLLTREAGRGPGLARLADCRRLAEIQWRRTLPSTHHPAPLPSPRPRHHREPPRLPARPLSSDELSQRPETQDGHCRDAAAAGRRPGRGHCGKGRPRPSGHGQHRRLADRCLSRGVATSTSTRSSTSRVHVPHGSPSGCRR